MGKKTMRQQKEQDRRFWKRMLCWALLDILAERRTKYADQTYQDFCQALENEFNSAIRLIEANKEFAIYLATQPPLTGLEDDEDDAHDYPF